MSEYTDEQKRANVEYIAQRNAEYDEAKRVDRWHATYNAALQGLYAHRSDSKDPRHHEIHLDALIAAEIAHGHLEPKS